MYMCTNTVSRLLLKVNNHINIVHLCYIQHTCPVVMSVFNITYMYKINQHRMLTLRTRINHDN